MILEQVLLKSGLDDQSSLGLWIERFRLAQATVKPNLEMIFINHKFWTSFGGGASACHSGGCVLDSEEAQDTSICEGHRQPNGRRDLSFLQVPSVEQTFAQLRPCIEN
jgi:hypothetical protein